MADVTHTCASQWDARDRAARRAYAYGAGYSVYRNLLCRVSAGCYVVRADRVVVDPAELVLVARYAPGDVALAPGRPEDLGDVLELLDQHTDPDPDPGTTGAAV